MNQLGRTFHAVLFDVDGTLLDSTAAVTAVWTRWAARMGLRTSTVLARCRGRTARSIIAELAPDADLELEVAWVLGAARTEPTPVAAIPGAVNVLRALHVPWAVVSSSPRALARRRLAQAGLPVPAVVIGCDRVSRGKPEPEGYLAAATALKVRPHECLAFEDTPTGVSAARRAGMSVIALATTHRAGQLFADAVIDDYTTILPHAFCSEPVGGYRRLAAEMDRAAAAAVADERRRLRATA